MTKLSKRLPDDKEKLQLLVGEINWSHNLNIFKRAQAKLAVKDEYTFDFLEIAEELNTVAASLAATVKKNFEEFGI